MYPTPAYLRKTIQLMVWLTILAWATQLLFSSWARGDEPVLAAQVPVELGGSEKFVPGGERFYAGATLEFKAEANVIGEEVKLKQVCRWADSDKAAFEPIADLVLVRLPKGAPYKTFTVRELRDTLHDAGVNLAVLHFAGATTCTVARTDVKFDERSALDQWIAAKDQGTTKPPLIEAPATQPVKNKIAEATQPVEKVKFVADAKPYKSLRDFLAAETSERLNVPVDSLQFHFSPADEKLLNLSEPQFQFNVKTPWNKNLGEVTWDVLILADGSSQKVSITGTVKAWQNQLVVNRPLPFRQVIQDDDVIDRRALVDQLSDDPLVTRAQVVGQMTARELKSGSLLTARLIDPTVLVKSGQLVSVTLTQGAIRAKSVARATEQGTLGQTIRVRNETTNNQFDVIVTGEQTAKLPPAASMDGSNVSSLDH
jgi:flagella basal body P-ring formation protein FlgA